MDTIYLDNAATTKTDADTAAEAMEMMLEDYGNPSSPHSVGINAQKRLDKARARVSAALGCRDDELVFTSGATEANNMAILGGAEALKRRGDGIIAAAFEHDSVLAPVKKLGERGFRVNLVNPEPDGRIDAEAFADAVDDKTIIASCMLVNSETGAVQDIKRLSGLIREKNKTCLIHCDAVQAFGKLPFTAKELGVDLLSVSAHKLYAPKGCGALYVRGSVRIIPLIYGGGQEKGMRPGTEASALIAAFGHAAEKAATGLKENYISIGRVCEYFVNKARNMRGVCINSPEQATPYIMNISVLGYKSANIINFLSAKGIYVSGGSACSGGARSHVLMSMGLPLDRVDSAVRVSFGKNTSTQDVDRFFEALEDAIKSLAN